MAKKKMYRMRDDSLSLESLGLDYTVQKIDKVDGLWRDIAYFDDKKDAQAFLKYKEGER